MKLIIATLALMMCHPVYAQDAFLIGGTVTTSREIVNTYMTGTSSFRCTGTVIGPRTLLTAGHCYKNREVAGFSIDGMNVKAQCYRNPDYSSWFGNALNDHTLCYTDKEIKYPYAFIDTRPVQKGEIVQLAGYGCFNTKKQNDGKLRAGLVQVSSVQSKEFVTVAGNNMNAALCFGDSGGSSWRYGDGYYNVAEQTGGLKYVIGVNSKGNIATVSYLALLSNNSFKKFADQYMKATLTPICGLVQCK